MPNVFNGIINHLNFCHFHRLELAPATPQACADTCPVTNAYRGFSAYSSNCYCWYDDGLVPSTTSLGGQVFSNWDGVGPVTTVMEQFGATCYKSIHTNPPTQVPSRKPSQKPTVSVHHYANLSIVPNAKSQFYCSIDPCMVTNNMQTIVHLVKSHSYSNCKSLLPLSNSKRHCIALLM